MAVVTDIRIQDTFFDNRKIVKLKRRLGPDALLCLIRLWMYTAKNAPKGILFDMDDDDIEIAACWQGGHGEFVHALVDLALLDKDNGIAQIHDWESSQPWAFKSDIRSERARLGGVAKAEKLLQADCKHAASMPQADLKHAGSNAPLLSSPLLSSPDLSKPKTPRKRGPQAAPAGSIEDRFARFWAVVSKRVGKAQALVEFRKIDPDEATLVLMIDSMREYAKKERQYQKDPERWVKYRRWEDEQPGKAPDKAPEKRYKSDLELALEDMEREKAIMRSEGIDI